MGNLYIYGCSFSYGDGIFTSPDIEPHTYWGRKYEDWYWGNQISGKFNLNLINRAHGGLSNDTTVKRVLEDITYFTDSDVVVIGITQPDRVTLEPLRMQAFKSNPKVRNMQSSLFPDLNAGLVKQYLSKSQKDKEKYLKGLSDLVQSETPNVEEWDLLHMTALYWFQGYENKKMYSEYYKKVFSDIVKLIDKLGSKVVLWGVDYWNFDFEPIKIWLSPIADVPKRLTLDSHFSPNGNTYFAMEIADAIDNGIQIMEWKQRKKVWYEGKSSYFKPYVQPPRYRTLI